ncbi:MAG: AMP-binding protein [Bacteroidales bacterium]|nr:AMP-binding protein [Bacteroidales bacterium]
MTKHFFEYFNEVFPARWNEPALTDYNGDVSYTFGDVAAQVQRIGNYFRTIGIQPGDKIAICGRNCANWAVAYLAIASYGGIIVSILQDFHGDDIKELLKHSDSKALFIGPYVLKGILEEEAYKNILVDGDPIREMLPQLQTIISLTDFSTLFSATETISLEDFEIPVVDCEQFCFPVRNPDNQLLINYTSGSMGAPKGVMLSYRSLSSNIEAGLKFLPNKPGWKVVSMLPLAHMYGQLAEFLYPLANGCHIYFLTKTPTPTLLMKAFAEVHPYEVVTVPLVIEKIYKRSLAPVLDKKVIRSIMYVPLFNRVIKKVIKNKLMKAFGGELKYFMVGGAALNEDVERNLLNVGFPLVVGYGMTECGPLIGGCHIKDFVPRSSGHILPNNEIRIDSADPYREVGEILVRGEHVMMGYYKNEEATKAAFTEDGWLRTGDLGLIDKNNNIFIKGRNKNMILGASGQNIYPEEIEDKLNNMEGVVESVVVEREGKLVALVFPDYAKDGNLEFDSRIVALMKENLQKINNLLPKYSQISKIELQKDEFDKTPKKSIKRFLYK